MLATNALEARRARPSTRFPLRESAKITLNRQLRTGIDDAAARRPRHYAARRGAPRFVHDDREGDEPHIICSLGLSHSLGLTCTP